MADTQTPKVKLDWSRLLVFDQAPATVVDAEAAGRVHDPRLAKLGIKPKLGHGGRYIGWTSSAHHDGLAHCQRSTLH